MVSETPVPEPKPGYLTSEFWLGVAAQLLVWYEAINPSFHVTSGQQTKLTLAAGALSLLATAYYTASRKQVKTAHQAAVATVSAAAVSAATLTPIEGEALAPVFASGGVIAPGLPVSPYESIPQAEKRGVEPIPMRSSAARRTPARGGRKGA